MDQTLINAVFQPKPSKHEAKADVTTRVAREVIFSETTLREAKTERLRAARLAHEAKGTPAVKTKKKVRPNSAAFVFSAQLKSRGA